MQLSHNTNKNIRTNRLIRRIKSDLQGFNPLLYSIDESKYCISRPQMKSIMDPVIDNEWLGYKNDPIDDTQNVGNVARSWQWREQGINPTHAPSNKTVLENIAEDILVRKPLKIRCCDLPGYPRSTFLMVFSPDGTKVASTHGNHNVYVSELASGKHVRILKGHPRTPWCIAFHPSHPQLIGSGCLGGQVRVWDISSGGSEVWNVCNETVIASIAFHPREQLLVIATYNELYFWDWSQPAPFTKVSTNNVNEKVRYVAFDALGYKLITGISLWSSPTCVPPTVLHSNGTWLPTNTTSNNNNNNRREDLDESSSNTNRPQENSGTAQDMIVNSYQNLVQRYDSLVRNYQRLFMVRHRLISNPPPPPNMIDRGTDPMETDLSPGTSSRTRSARPSTSTASFDQANPTPGPSRRRPDAGDIGDGEGNSSPSLNLDALPVDWSVPWPPERPLYHPLFSPRSSAFHPLNSHQSDSVRSFRTVDQSERPTRLFPNPFSSSSGTPESSRITYAENSPRRLTINTARTSIFASSRPEPLNRDFSRRRRNSSPSQHTSNLNRNSSSSNINNDGATTSTARPLTILSSSILENLPSTSRTATQRPTMTNSSTQMSPVSAPVDQTINESLNLIRDILRDSGTRLLNLITNMSLSTLASVERNIPRRGAGSRAHSDDGERSNRPRGVIRPRVRLFSSSLRRDFLSSSSDSDSDQSLEVNIFRTRNSTFREDEVRENEQLPASTPTTDRVSQPTNRMVFELNDETRTEDAPRETNGINVSMTNSRFRVRTQNNTATDDPQPSTSTSTSTPRERESAGSRSQSTSDVNPDRPSTSRDNFWTRGCVVPPDEAYRKVKGGVIALQKHTMQLTNMWLRGNRVTMRELRTMWENLRRRILMLHRETGRQDLPSYYTRSLLERCMMLTEMTDNITRTNRTTRNHQRNEDNDTPQGENRSAPATSENASNPNPADSEANSSTVNPSETRPTRRNRSPLTRSTGIRSSPSLRRRLQSSYRWRPEDEIRRRSRNPTTNRWAPRYSNRSRRDFARAIEISATRHEIRMRAMQVLSVMFNMMMMCLEERGLSQIIINMLRTLKKALALTCLMLMTNRNNTRSNNNLGSTSQRVDMNVVRIVNVEHLGPINVDGTDDPSSPNVLNDMEEERLPNEPSDQNQEENDIIPPIPTEDEIPMQSEASTPAVIASTIQRWSNRLAVQIAAANRNNSLTARTRRDLYLESRRQKALHRTNPTSHPLIRKRVLPPVTTYRIPALRSWITKAKVAKKSNNNPRPDPIQNEPVAGPSNASPPVENSNQESPRSEVMNEFEHRVNLIRIAHMQAIRLRNAARNRFRRLQTIRLYTPSSVREMFALQTHNTDNNPPGNRSPLQPELGGRRPFATYRPNLTPRSESTYRPAEDTGNFHPILRNVAMPLMQVDDITINSTVAENHLQRLPRIHEYLQPIILAQNAMLVDDDGAGGEGGGGGGGGGPGPSGPPGPPGPRRMSGMAGLLDAGIISEALPAPSHRVQAWNFTTGDTPDIADSTKNVVVQKCRIHNDASIDISKDGRLLVALLPVPRLRNTNHWLGVYSLEWPRLGQCLHTAVLEQSAVSVALSPTARHLAVGLGSRRFTSTTHGRGNVFALLYRLEPLESSSRTGLSPIKELEQNWEHGFTSLNCLRWAPQPGQGLVYANNTGQLIIMS